MRDNIQDNMRDTHVELKNFKFKEKSVTIVSHDGKTVQEEGQPASYSIYAIAP